MAFGLYLWSKPPGGGPAPLIFNPVSKLVGNLIIVHVMLCILSGGSFSFPFIADISCPGLQTNSIYCAVCSGCRTWGTETEWAYASIVTMTVAVGDVCVAGWGIYVWVMSSKALFSGESEEFFGNCESAKGYAFYFITAGIITINVTVAIFCSIVSVLLAKRVNSQLEELRRLV